MKTKKIIFGLVLVTILIFTIFMVCSVSSATDETETATELPEADSSGTITLTSDVELTTAAVISETVTIDLNGYTISNSSSSASGTGKATIYVTIDGNLTIEDSDGSGMVTNANLSTYATTILNEGTVTIKGGTYANIASYDSSVSSSDAWYTLLNHGTMTIEDATVYNTANTDTSLVENGYQNYISENQSTGYVDGINSASPTLTINGGTFTNYGLNVIKNDDGGILEINDGTFSSKRSSGKTTSTGAAILNWNIATVNGGEFIIEESASLVAGVISNGYCDSTYDIGQLTINGGTFTSNNDTAVLLAHGQDATECADAYIKITDGSFTGEIDDEITYYSVYISGGTFSEDVPDDYVVDGYTAYQTSDGSYIVTTTISEIDDLTVGSGETLTLSDELSSTVYSIISSVSTSSTLLTVNNDDLTITADSTTEESTEEVIVTLTDGTEIVVSVTVEAAELTETTVEDEETGVTVTAVMSDDAELVVSEIEADEDLENEIEEEEALADGYSIIGSYDVSIIGGEYEGDITVSFNVGSDYEGMTAYIFHKKSSGEIEQFTDIIKDGLVTVTVTELSPFVVAVVDTDEETSDDETTTTDDDEDTSSTDENDDETTEDTDSTDAEESEEVDEEESEEATEAEDDEETEEDTTDEADETEEDTEDTTETTDDTEDEEENPNTSDTILSDVAIGLLGIIMIIGTTILKRRK